LRQIRWHKRTDRQPGALGGRLATRHKRSRGTVRSTSAPTQELPAHASSSGKGPRPSGSARRPPARDSVPYDEGACSLLAWRRLVKRFFAATGPPEPKPTTGQPGSHLSKCLPRGCGRSGKGGAARQEGLLRRNAWPRSFAAGESRRKAFGNACYRRASRTHRK
jgi:hypothetical protein